MATTYCKDCETSTKDFNKINTLLILMNYLFRNATEGDLTHWQVLHMIADIVEPHLSKDQLDSREWLKKLDRSK